MTHGLKLYWSGLCRCEECCAASAEYMRNRGARRGVKPRVTLDHKPYQRSPRKIDRTLTLETVRDAIQNGANTRQQIAEVTNYHEDTVSNALGILYGSGEIRIKSGIIQGERARA